MAPHVMEKKFQRDLQRQAELEEKLIKHCRIPSQAGALQRLQVIHNCRSFLESVIRFDESFQATEKSMQYRSKFIDIFDDLLHTDTPLVWPKQNRMLAFPKIQFPKEIQCFFAPETDLQGCNGVSRWFRSDSTLGERLVSYVLSKDPLVHNTTQSAKIGPNYIFMNTTLYYKDGSAVLNIFPEFWGLGSRKVVQFSVIFHETDHMRLNSSHTLCKDKDGGYNCDDFIGNNAYTMGLLIKEIALQSFIYNYRYRRPLEPKERALDIRRVAVILTWQCADLEKFVHLPILFYDLFPCSQKTSRTFVKNHLERFTVEPSPT